MKKRFSRFLAMVLVLCLIFTNVSFAECAHDWDFLYDPVGNYEAVNENYHKIVSETLYYICEDCGETKVKTEYAITQHESKHNFNSQNICYDCGYEGEEVHEHDWDFLYDPVGNYEAVNENYHKIVSETLYYICNDCGETKVETEYASTQHESKHNFNSQNICYDCGYEGEAVHEHDWEFQNEKPFFCDVIDETYHEVTDTVVFYACTGCEETKIEFDTVSIKARHNFNNDVCVDCSYKKVIEVTPTPTVEATDTPTTAPTDTPTTVPTDTPTAEPTDTPTAVPTDTPTPVPTEAPTVAPTVAPTDVPTPTFTNVPMFTPIVTVVPTEKPIVTAVPTEKPTATVVPTPAPTTHVCTYKDSHWRQDFKYFDEDFHSYSHVITPICTVCGQKGEQTRKIDYAYHKYENGICEKCKHDRTKLSAETELFIRSEINELSEILNVAIKLKEYKKISTSHCADLATIVSNKISEYNQVKDGKKSINEVDTWRNVSELVELWAKKDEVKNYNYEEEETIKINLEEPDNKWYYIALDTGEQMLLGNFSEKVTVTGVASQIIVGEIPFVGTAADLRDIAADIKNWEWTWQHAGTTALDIIGLVPIVGSLKYVDEATIIAKGVKLSEKAGETLTTTVKHLDDIGDSGKHSNELANAVGDAITKHIDENNAIIEGAQAVSKASSKVLRENMIKAGIKVPEYPNAAHHIVAGNAKGAEEARVILQKFDIDINDASNGVFLPTQKGVANSAYHPGLHTNAYYVKVNEQLRMAETKEEILSILDDIAEELNLGTFFD